MAGNIPLSHSLSLDGTNHDEEDVSLRLSQLEARVDARDDILTSLEQSDGGAGGEAVS